MNLKEARKKVEDCRSERDEKSRAKNAHDKLRKSLSADDPKRKQMWSERDGLIESLRLAEVALAKSASTLADMEFAERIAVMVASGKADIVLLVSVDSYSDYRVIGAFDIWHAEDAKKMALHYNGDVEEMKLNMAIPSIPDGFRCFVCQTRSDGETVCFFESDPFSVSLDGGFLGVFVQHADFDWKARLTGINAQLVTKHWAKNEEHAKKIASEKAMQVKAIAIWPADCVGDSHDNYNIMGDRVAEANKILQGSGT